MPGQLIGSRMFGERRFELVVHDLLAEPTEAIVNAANSELAHGGGVAGVIARAAGPGFYEEGQRLVRERGAIPTGQAVVTSAGALPFEGVIHAVGPRLGDGDEEALLASACLESFRRARERGWRSLSFPAISSGIFRVPLEVCAAAYRRGLEAFFAEGAGSVRLIRLVAFEGPVLEACRAELARAPGWQPSIPEASDEAPRRKRSRRSSTERLSREDVAAEQERAQRLLFGPQPGDED